MAARSSSTPVTILNLRGRNANSGWKSRPLSQHRGRCVGQRTRPLLTSQMGPGDVSDAVAAGLNCVHADCGETVENQRYVLQVGPVVLDVLSRREMTVATVEVVGD